jgi:PD-(D/E)XK nuclease superfamily/Exodeoxyribonuclease V, gamma subunit
MLTLFHSTAPCLPLTGALPPEAATVLTRLSETPVECLWIVPTHRRRRALERAWLEARCAQAGLTPTWHTLEGLVQEALAYSMAWLPSVGNAERLLLVSHAWQEASGQRAGAGFLRELDRLARDWQAAACPGLGDSRFDRFVRCYREGLNRRRRLERMSCLSTLMERLREREEGPISFLQNYAFFFFDGFHRFEIAELEWIACLSDIREVCVWLVGSAGQTSWRCVEFAIKFLKKRSRQFSTIEFDAAPSPLAAVGRRLFPALSQPEAVPTVKLPQLMKVEAPSALDEVEQVATLIKTAFRRTAEAGQPMRLSEVAIVIPGPEYDPLVRAVLPRAGLSFNLAGRALDLAASRPARLLHAALELIRGQWRADLVLDYLMQPALRMRLAEASRLHALFEHRPRQRQSLDFGIWQQAWQAHLHEWRQALEMRTTGSGENAKYWEFGDAEALDRSTRLVQSLEAMLSPVVALERALGAGAAATEFLAACARMFETARLDDWLTPRPGALNDPALWVEYEKDQRAFEHLETVLQKLAEIAPEELPRTADDRLDWPATLELALASESFQIRTEDDAGVQVFEIREIRGLAFRHVYALGLVEGQFPPQPEEGALADLRQRVPALAEQARLQETEHTWLFAQLFEAAQERLVLSRPTRAGDAPLLPSLYLAAVEALAELEPLPAPRTLAGRGAAAAELGLRSAQASSGASIDEIWTGLSASAKSYLTPLAGAVAASRGQASEDQLQLTAPWLLARVLFDDKSFTPTELETYAACPFRFFGTRLLRLQEREADDTRLCYGSLLHRALEKTYVEFRRTHSELSDTTPLPPLDARGRQSLQQFFISEWQKMPSGFLPAELNTLFCETNGVQELVFGFLEAIENDNDLGNLYIEFRFENLSLGVDRAGRPVRLTGVVDRVDVSRRAPQVAYVFDYKTGMRREYGELEIKAKDGRLMQLGLYGLAVHEKWSLETVGAAYLFLSERRKKGAAQASKRIAAAGKFVANGNSQTNTFDLEQTRRITLELAGEMRAGNISLTRFAHGKYCECTSFCAMREACRVSNCSTR